MWWIADRITAGLSNKRIAEGNRHWLAGGDFLCPKGRCNLGRKRNQQHLRHPGKLHRFWQAAGGHGGTQERGGDRVPVVFDGSAGAAVDSHVRHSPGGGHDRHFAASGGGVPHGGGRRLPVPVPGAHPPVLDPPAKTPL